MQFPSVYKIVNTTNNKYYVGSSRTPYKRWNQHKYNLSRKKHCNDYRQNSWNKYGESSFSFSIIKCIPTTISDLDLLAEEQKWLELASKDPLTYNLTFIAGNPNAFLSEYSKKKRSESLKRVIKTEEWKSKISKSHLGIKPSVQSRLKMKLAKQGKKQTGEQKANATESRRRDWTFKSPSGGIVHIHDLKDFCRKNRLHSGCMYWVASGKKQQHKGWRK